MNNIWCKSVFFMVATVAILDAGEYRLFFGAYDATYPKRAMSEATKVVAKLKKVGLDAEVTREKKKRLLVVKSPLIKEKETLMKARQLAEKAGVSYFIKTYLPKYVVTPAQERSQVDTSVHKVTESVKTYPTRQQITKSSKEPLFGDNPQQVYLIEEGLTYQKRLIAQKDAYLKTIERAYGDLGVALKFSGEHALGRNRDGYDAGVEWRLLEGGVAGNHTLAGKMRILESIAYDRDVSEMTHNYLQMAADESHAIENYIRYVYQEQKVRKYEKFTRLAGRKMQAGLLTRWQYDRIKSDAQKASETLAYLSLLEKKPFDSRYSDLIRQMDHIRLMPLEQLTKVALQRSVVLHTLTSQIQLLEKPQAWYEQVSADIYLDRKQYTFVDRRETLAGMRLKVPLKGVDADNEARKLKAKRLRLKQESFRQLLRQKIRRYYTELFYHRNQIITCQEEIAMTRKSLGYLRKQPALSFVRVDQSPDIGHMKAEITLLDLEQKVWQERAKILENLIVLQYLSGIDVL